MIIAVVGMTGSGKSVVSEVLRAEGIPTIRFGQFVIDEMKRRGLAETAESERLVREELRQVDGMAALAKLATPAIREQLAKTGIVGIDGLYSYSEYRTLQEAFAQVVLLAVFTPRSLRYARLERRGERPLSPAAAEARDRAEIENIEKGGPIALADYTLLNDGTADELAEKCRQLLRALLVQAAQKS